MFGAQRRALEFQFIVHLLAAIERRKLFTRSDTHTHIRQKTKGIEKSLVYQGAFVLCVPRIISSEHIIDIMNTYDIANHTVSDELEAFQICILEILERTMKIPLTFMH